MEISNAAADQLAEVIASYVNDNGDDRVQLIGEVLGEDSSGTTWVHILGGEQRTPVTSTNAKVHKGDIVYVVIGDGRADILGNVSRPSTDDTLAEVVQQRVVETERVVERIEATAITADSAEIQQLNADHAVIETLDSTYASIGSLTAATARIGDIEADYLKAADMTAEQARVGQLIAGKADVADLTAANARIDSLESTKADISFLESDYITAAAIEANYLHADMSNADVAWIQNGVIKDGSISNAMINDVSANKLTAGTINGSVINVTNLNADNITAGTINGQRIGEGSLSLDKLSEDVYTESEVDSKLATMQAEIDGAIETWTGTAVPTLNNSPASNWTTAAVRDTHVGDVYFVVNSQSEQNGYNYRFTKTNGTYSWQLIKDSDVTNALQRLSTAEGKITTFDSDISTLKTDTGTLKTKTESLETRMSDAEDDILDKVDTTTFNEVSDTVDQHSQTITQMSQTLSNKADGSTVTALTTRVSKTEQDITGINTTIGELQTTVESKADSSTVETVSNKLNTVSDTVDGHTQSITSINSTLETKADSSTVSTLTTKVNNVSDTVDGHTQTIGSMQTTQTTMQGKLDKTIVETTQLWYSKSSTDAPSKPTSQVTSTSTAGNAWRTVVPAYNASYPNYFYCYQWKYTDGTYGWSSVTRDIAMGESQERARTAISNAATADTKAGNAATAAATAQSTADTAKSTADTAKATADKNVKSSLQLWYTKANETAPAKPTSKVTSTSVSGNAWRTVVPTYSASYPYYFYCYQYELADGTYTWSDVVYDRATTENQSNSRSAVSGVSTLTTKTNEISDTVDGHTSQLSSITTTQTSIQGSAVKSTVQLWFTKANTTAPNKPTAHVTTNNASTANAWNLAVPTYNSSYPYYYYCYEHQLLNDTYTWSAVTRDIATEESQSTSRSAASAAAAADTKAGNAASAAAAADTKAGNAAAAAATADGKAVSAQNTANKNVRESQQLWYTKANSTAPAKPTSKVTSTATTGGAWTTRVPTYSDSYKHYFYCMQYVAADGTVTWSDVVYDQATTEAQSVARAASADLTEFHQEYATFKQTTQEFESTVGETYATKNELKTTDDKIENLEIGGRNLLYNTADWSSWACTAKATVSNGVLTTANTDTSAFQRANGWFTLAKSDLINRTITVSFEAKKTDATALDTLCIQLFTTSAAPKSVESGNIQEGTRRFLVFTAPSLENASSINSSTWTKVSWTFKPSEVLITSGYTDYAYLALYIGIINKAGSAQYRNIKAEFGTNATDWTPAPEDIEASVSSIEERVSTAETSITNNSREIGLRAKASDVYTKAQSDGLIATEVTNRDAAIKASADAIKLTVSQTYTTKTEFENLKIGGRNLIRNTGTYDGWGGTDSSEVTIVEEDGGTYARISPASVSWSNIYGKSHRPVEMLNGKTVTISCDVRAHQLTSTSSPVILVLNAYDNSESTTRIGVIDNNFGSDSLAENEWVRLSRTIEFPDDARRRFGQISSGKTYEDIAFFDAGLYNHGGFPIDFRHLKVEFGNRDTDWTPAPEDATERIVKAETAIGQNAEAIKLTATKEEVEKTYSTKDEVQLDRSGSGTSVAVEGAANASLKSLHILGKSVQDGTPTPDAPVEIQSVGAVNLLDEANFLKAYIANSITANSNHWTFWLPCNPNTTYTVSKTMRENGVDRFAIGYTATVPAAGVEVSSVLRIQTTESMTYAGQRVIRTYTTGSNAKYIVIWAAYSTFDSNDSEYAKLQVSVGSHEVQYVPHGNLGLLTRGKNLLWRTMTGGTVNGVTFTVNADGSVSTSGTATGTATLEITNIWLQAGTYTLSGSPSGGSYSSYLMDMNASPVGADTGNGFTFTLAEDTVLPYLRIRIAAGTVTDGLTFRPQIEKGSEATEYEPYSSTVTPIHLNGHELRSLPDGTHDELTIDADGHVTMTQRVGAYHMADYVNNPWSKSGSATNGYYMSYSHLEDSEKFALNKAGNIYSNMASPATTASEYFAGPNKAFVDSCLNFNLDGSVVGTTTAGFKSWLGSSNLMAYTGLATPQTIDLGTIDMPQVHDGDTVEVIAALTPSIDVTWWASAGQAVADAYASLSSAIEVRAESIVSTVSERYATSQEVQAISSQIEQTAQSWTAQFNELTGGADLSMTLAQAFETLGVTSDNLEEIRSFVRITTDDAGDPLLLMGSATSPIMLALSNDSLRFMHGSDPVAYIDVDGTTNEGRLHITRAVVVKELQFGSWKWFERDGVGNLALKWVGDE